MGYSKAKLKAMGINRLLVSDHNHRNCKPACF